MNITMEEINREGFVFHKYKAPEYIRDEIKSLIDFREPVHPGGGGSGYEGDVESLIPNAVSFYTNLIEDLGIARLGIAREDYLHFDLERIDIGNYHDMHSHGLPAKWQCCIWIPTNDFYVGRQFIYGIRGEKLKEIKPQFGDMVFFKPNDPIFIHGVTPLRTTQPVFSIGITCSSYPERFIARDSFAPEYQVQNYDEFPYYED